MDQVIPSHRLLPGYCSLGAGLKSNQKQVVTHDSHATIAPVGTSGSRQGPQLGKAVDGFTLPVASIAAPTLWKQEEGIYFTCDLISVF